MIEVEVRNLSFLIGDSRRVVTGHAPETCLTYLPREVAPHRIPDYLQYILWAIDAADLFAYPSAPDPANLRPHRRDK